MINAVAFLIMTWSSPSGWPFAFLYAIFNLAVFTAPALRLRRLTPDLAILLCTYFLIGLPLLLAPWGLQQVHQFTADGDTRAYWTNVFATGRSSSQWVKILPVFNAYAWGTTPIRQIFNTLVLCLGLIHVATIPRHRRTLTILGVIFIAVLIMNILAVEKSVWVFGITRAVPLLPYYLMLLAAGLLYPATRPAKLPGWTCTILLCLGGLILWWEPLTLIPQINGFPRPFAAMSAWADGNLPADTPVLTDRYFTAYNEYRVHPPTQVQFVSAAPNQIPEQYLGMQFRERVMQFFQDNPAAAFYEEKHLWNRPE
ncbi:MAG: hypothetical protein LC725_09210, partial [Lentisphaerae bacterium]|nr:hypothetical protein [Lentisphaerota bacterium]